MTSKITETDKEVLQRIMSEPTFESVAAAARKENALREGKIKEILRNSTPTKAEGQS